MTCRWRYYFKNSGYVSAGVFHKDISNFSFRDTTVDARWRSSWHRFGVHWLGDDDRQCAGTAKITGYEPA